jgi:hypothetical protein
VVINGKLRKEVSAFRRWWTFWGVSYVGEDGGEMGERYEVCGYGVGEGRIERRIRCPFHELLLVP